MTHCPRASMTFAPCVASGASLIAATRPPRMPRFRTAPGLPRPSNQRPFSMMTSKVEEDMREG